jgi:hypothetical protein
MTQFVTKGDQYLTPVQLERRAQKYIRRSWPDQKREKSIRLGDGQFDAFMTDFSANHDTNKANNTFNWQLEQYRKATKRLAQYVLADGRPELTEMQPTGEQVFNEDTGEMEDVLHEVVVQTAVEPLPATVEILVYNEEDPEAEPTVETVDNPEIIRDTEERAAAQAVVDATPDEVVAFAA